MSRNDFLLKFKSNLSTNKFINYYLTEDSGFSITFLELNRISDRVKEFLWKAVNGNFQFIGLFFSDYLWLPCLLLSIWKSGKSCACIGTYYTEEYNSKFLDVLRVKYLVSDCKIPFKNTCLLDTFHINDQRIFIWERMSGVSRGLSHPPPLDICYGIMTSGSTGIPKIVQVPWSCIIPNVYELIDICCITENDNICLSSPFSFDPFFIELFTSMITGCTLTIVSFGLKLLPNSLLKIFFIGSKYRNTKNLITESNNQRTLCFNCKVNEISNSFITVLQMTPSVFKRWTNNDIKNVILASSTSLRVLLLGGEKFPLHILKLKALDNATKIYNIYGITEISCWAFINDLTTNCEDLSLGIPLNDIVYKIDENNEFFLGSKTRICLIDDETSFSPDEVIYRKTGDLVCLRDDKINYISRSNQLVKKYGIRINLELIENLFLSINSKIEECCCVFDESAMQVVIFYENRTLKQDYFILTGKEKEITNLKGLSQVMTSAEMPDYVIEIKKMPLNNNGKQDRRALLQFLKDIVKKQTDDSDVSSIFLNVWSYLMDSQNFVTSGGDSVKALQMTARLKESGIEVPKEFVSVLLNNGEYENCLACLLQNYKGFERDTKKIKLNLMTNKFKLINSWIFNTNKCVDASPTVFSFNGTACVIVGSHSSRLSSIEVETGKANWSVNLGDRIESGFCINKSSTYGMVGCYDHHIYCISVSDGLIIWKYKTGGMIKSTPCLSTDEKTIYVASYDTYLYCLTSHDGMLINKLKLCDRGIFCSGICLDELITFCIGTLDGTCISIYQETNEINWKHQLRSPIFSSPVLVINEQADPYVIFTEVTGFLNCFNAKTGVKIWRYECNGNVYSTPTYSAEFKLLVYGCYDNHLYCLKLKGNPSPKWKIELDSAIFSRPCLFSTNISGYMIAVATTKGYIYLCQLDSGCSVSQTKLNGEIFSSPKINQQNLLIGCRDNNLYCLKILQHSEEFLNE